MSAQGEGKLARKKKAPNRFSDEDMPRALAAAVRRVSGVDEKTLPSRAQWERWGEYLLLKEFGVAPSGQWYGHCPLHDTERNRKKPTAMFGFYGGSIWCLSDPPCTHPKRAMTLVNVSIEMMRKLEDANTG